MSNINLNDTTAFPFTANEAMEFTDRVSAGLKIMNYTGFADMSIEPPDINFYPDEPQFFDPASNEIHIGVHGIVGLFHPEDETDFLSALNYIYGHEQQHRRSTATRPYALAIQKGCEAVLEYIQTQVEPFKRKFKKESDYADFANRVLPSMNIYISWNMVRDIIGGITNSLEDGRIERIRSNRWHGFNTLRMVYRGRYWDMNNMEFEPYENIQDNKPEKLRLIINEILSLATCQLYSKGFAMAYTGTPLMDEVNVFMPDIAKAVISGRTRGLLDPVVEISKRLAPYIYETCKLSQSEIEARKALEEMMADLIKSMIDNMPTDMNLSENMEDTDDGSLNSSFPMSDLVVTLDDETYDKLMKNSQEGEGQGIMVQREHPLEDETGEKKEDANGSSGSSDSSETKDGSDSLSSSSDSSKSDTDSDGKSSSSSASDDAKENGQSSGKENKSDSASSQNSSSSNSTAGQSEGDATDSANSAKQEASSSAEQKVEEKVKDPRKLGHSNGDSTGKNQAAKHVSEATRRESEKVVLEAMKEAASLARIEAETNISQVNTAISSGARRATSKEKVDVSKPISPAEMKDICDFKELKREYKVSDNLPAVLAQRGKVLRRKNEQYFKSLSTPNVSYLDSGLIDPSRIYGLAMGDTEIFRKKGKDKKFDGAAYMLVDNSGSMYGNKRMEACKAAAVIEEGFKGIIPLKIVAFDECGQVIHEVIKNWDEVLNKNCCWNFAQHGRDGCGNEDGYDIAIATRELLARPERKKLLLVLSDGAPGNTNYCREAIAHARKQGIQVVGIYFEEGECRGNSTFEHMYQKDFICCPLNELDMNLNTVFKKFSRS